MRRAKFIWSICLLALCVSFSLPLQLHAETHGASLFFSPSSGTVLTDATFDVSVLLNTQGKSVNSVELDLKFPADKLQMVKPSSDKSLLSLWLEPPVYSNTAGTARLVGIIPNGITTSGGLIATMTFKAIATGTAVITVQSSSRVLANDGAGTDVLTGFGRATWEITPQPPAGVTVTSETHPFSDQWYNNNSPALQWEKDDGVTDFSFLLDHEPFTVPDDNADGSDTIVSYNELADGIWYFHIKARKDGVWGSTTHYALRIDTTPPAEFTPTSEALSSGQLGRVLISYFTTDALSGIDHYEVGAIDLHAPADETPAFVVADSPYQIPDIIGKSFRVVVRVFDRAGNVRDEQIQVTVATTAVSFVEEHLTVVFLSILGLILLFILFHLVFRHRMLSKLRLMKSAIKIAEEEDHELEEASHHHNLEGGGDDQPHGY